jgi:hypothetical protein
MERRDDDLESRASRRDGRPGRIARAHVADMGQIRSLCDTADLGWRAIEVVRRLDESDDGSPITDRSGDHATDAREAWEAVLGDSAAMVTEAQGARQGGS